MIYLSPKVLYLLQHEAVRFSEYYMYCLPADGMAKPKTREEVLHSMRGLAN